MEQPVFDEQDVVEVEVIEHAPPITERSAARRIALQALYEIDAVHHEVGEVLARHLDNAQPPRKIARYVQRLVQGVLKYRDSIDSAVIRFAPDFPLEQIALVDRNVLRIAVYEFAIARHVPVSVAINEAVELAKLFGSETAPSFVNGVLGSLADDTDTLQILQQISEQEV